MADRNFARPSDDDQPNSGGEYVLVGSRFAYRDDKNVLRVHKTGDKVTLDDEQAQRLRAGKVGSPFQKPGEDSEGPEFVAVAVANEATLPADEDGFQASPAGTRNRKALATRMPTAEAEKDDKDADKGPIPAPNTSTDRRPAAGRK
jgi:hypothetical protein